MTAGGKPVNPGRRSILLEQAIQDVRFALRGWSSIQALPP